MHQPATSGTRWSSSSTSTPFVDGGWYWFDVVADETSTLREAGWYAPGAARAQGRLAVGICTFNRPADCVAALVAIAVGPDWSPTELDTPSIVADQGNQKVRDDAALRGQPQPRSATGCTLVEQAQPRRQRRVRARHVRDARAQRRHAPAASSTTTSSSSPTACCGR